MKIVSKNRQQRRRRRNKGKKNQSLQANKNSNNNNKLDEKKNLNYHGIENLINDYNVIIIL